MKGKIKALVQTLTISRLLWGLVISGIAVIVLLAGVSLGAIYQLVQSQKQLTDIVMPVASATQEVRRTVMTFILRNHDMADTRTLQALETYADSTPIADRFQSAMDQLEKRLQRAQAVQEETSIEKIKTLFNRMQEKEKIIYEIRKAQLTPQPQETPIQETPTQETPTQEALARHKAELKTIAAPLMASLDRLQSTFDDKRKAIEADARFVGDNVWMLITGVGAMAILLMLLMGRRIYRRIIGPINRAVAFAETIADGDLTAEIEKDHDDEVGLLVSKLSEMAHNLNSLIGQVQRSGIQVTSSATELSATSKQQEAVMKTQMESTNAVVKSVGEISSISEELVETMQKVASMSEQTAEFANSGQSDLSQMEEAMRHMENASKSISGKLEAINEKAANITSVVTTITKVADQTNLLSLNAAIEAEKAGEYGRGFTVVAREIRRLADQTAVATLDIDQMVQEMQSAVSAGVMEMDAFIAEVQKSAENVGRISIQLTRIIEQVKSLTPSFEGVNESMQYQSDNAQQINSAMVNLSEEMQQTVESLRESFMAIEQLNDAARGLQEEVSRFKVG